MFCQKCGKELENGSDFCPFCGEATGTTRTGAQNKSKKKVKKIALFSGLAAVVATIVIVLAVTLSGGGKYKSGYEGAVQHFIDFRFYFERSEADILAMAPEAFWQAWVDHEDEESMDALFERIQIKAEEKRAELQDHLKRLEVDYVIHNPEKLSNLECKEIENSLEKRSNTNYSAITEAYSFKLETILSATDTNERDVEEKDVVAVKMEGKWYLVLTPNIKYFENGYSGSSYYRWWVDAVV